jgi:peptidoglycan/LPS O-acetylase OafA/YrhL
LGQGRHLRRFSLPRLKPESEALLHLDCLRLIAAAGIVFFHLRMKIDGGTIWHRVIAATDPYFLFVDMFFVISGYVIAFVYIDEIVGLASCGRFLQRRIARLVPLHWATLAFSTLFGTAAMAMHIPMHHPEIYEFSCLPANVLLLQATGLCPHVSFNVPSWSISAEMCMYILAPLMLWVLRRSVSAMAGGAVAMLLLLTALHGTVWLGWMTLGAIRALPSFMFGMWLYGMKKFLRKMPYAPIGYWGCLIGFFIGCSLGLPLLGLLLVLYLAVLFAVGADGSLGKAPRLVRKAAAGGQLTYSSYMLHGPLMAIIVDVGAHAFDLHGAIKNALVGVTFLAVWPVSYVSLLLFERPLRRKIGALAAVGSPSGVAFATVPAPPIVADPMSNVRDDISTLPLSAGNEN